jgi:hypothetical protein
VSFDALSWAAKQNTGSSGTKLVLLGLAECADRKHNLAFPSIAALVEFSSLDRKSVISNLAKLEDAGLIADTGRRCGSTNQIKIYELKLESVPKTEPSQKRNSSDFSGNSPKNGTRNKSEPHSEAKASSSVGKHLIAFDWSPPLVSELPPRARACAEQWTDASYQTEGEAFLLYWRGERKMKTDWRDTWANRVIARHSAIMRDQKFGNAPTEIKGPAKPLTNDDARRMEKFYQDRGDTANADEMRRRYPTAFGEIAAKIVKIRAA